MAWAKRHSLRGGNLQVTSKEGVKNRWDFFSPVTNGHLVFFKQMCICAKELPLKDAPRLLTSVVSVIVPFCRNQISSTQSESVLLFFYKMSTYVGLSETSVWECPQYCKGIIKQGHKLIYMENYAAASHNIMTVFAICHNRCSS